MARIPKKRDPKDSTVPERVEVRMTTDEKREFQNAANRQGITLSHWMRRAAWYIIENKNGNVSLPVSDE